MIRFTAPSPAQKTLQSLVPMMRGECEPTNHLDLEAINALNSSLQRYEGTVLLVTHDHDVIDEVATRIWHFIGGRIEDFTGGYADYLEYTQEKALIASR